MRLGLLCIIIIGLSAYALAGSDPTVSWKTLGRLAFRPANPSKDVRSVLNKPIFVEGFMMPDEFNSDEVIEFLLLPVSRGCIHVPPPPPSDIIHAKMKGALTAHFYGTAVKVHGVLRLAQDGDGDFSYEMLVDAVEPFSQKSDHFN